MSVSKSNTKTTEVVEAEATEPKPRVSRLERARLALAAAEAEEAKKRAKKLEVVLARRAATMAVLSSNHEKLAAVDHELIELIGADAYAELTLPGPVCDQWSDEGSYVTLTGGRLVTVAEVKAGYEAAQPIRVELYEGHVVEYDNKAAYEKAVDDGEEEAVYGAVVTRDITGDTEPAAALDTEAALV